MDLLRPTKRRFHSCFATSAPAASASTLVVHFLLRLSEPGHSHERIYSS
uniref:Uncharacterized protein n=1 Tax=Heterorhabditis bacteriophora TaxID=37862 RepID=A0A1I7X6B1_HETBA